MTQTQLALSDLYMADETAWLEAMAELLRQGAHAELDHAHLQEYLSDMAKRDRREVESRLVVLVSHVLKWTYPPQRRSPSWRLTILEQRDELEGLAGSGVLRNHTEAVMADAYRRAVKRARADSDLDPGTCPAECPFTLDDLLTFDPFSS